MGWEGRFLVAVAVQGILNGPFHTRIERSRTAKISSAFLCQSAGQVASTALTVHRLAGGSQSKTLLNALMGLDLSAHDSIIRWGVCQFQAHAAAVWDRGA